MPSPRPEEGAARGASYPRVPMRILCECLDSHRRSCVHAPGRPRPICAQIEEILTAVDVDQNNQIEWTEFSALMADRWLRQDGDVDMELAVSLFKISDEDDLLDVNRMREYLTTIGEAPLDASEVDQIVAMADPKGTGRMTTETFRTLPCWQPPPMTESSMKAASILGGSSRPGTALAEGSSRNQDATGSSEGGGVTAG